MNLLVYKNAAENLIDSTKEYKGPSVHKTNSNVLFERLTNKEMIEGALQEPGASGVDSSKAITYNEWVRRKDAERRMRQRLMNEAKQEVRHEVFEAAQLEQEDLEVRLKIMEDWATQKKLSEA
jgi:hypothetical protein